MIRVRNIPSKSSKNRSSKHLMCLTGMKPAIWSMSNEALAQMSKASGTKANDYEAELERRARNRAKRKTPRPPSKKQA